MRRRRAGAALLAAVAALTLLAGCSEEDQGPALLPGAAQVDVDTPALRRARAEIGMDPCPRPTAAEPVDGGLPEVTLPCLGGGGEVSMAALRGPLVINLWQSFCGPCREEMPVLEEFSQRHGQRVPVLGIDYQDTRPAAAFDLAGETGATYPSVADPGGDLNGRGAFPAVRGLPYFVLVDEQGVITHVEAGGVTAVSEVEDMVEQHLGVKL